MSNEFAEIAYIIRCLPSADVHPPLYWSVFESDHESYGVWSFDVQDAKLYKTVGEAQEFSSSPDGLNLNDDQFDILPYIH